MALPEYYSSNARKFEENYYSYFKSEDNFETQNKVKKENEQRSVTKQNTKNLNSKRVKNNKKSNISFKASHDASKKFTVVIATVIYVIVTLIVIGYFNSIINEQFAKLQNTRKELSAVEKENEQLNVYIEKSLNYELIEKVATENLNLQKYLPSQVVYIKLPKKDYTQTNYTDIIKSEETTIERIIRHIKG